MTPREAKDDTGTAASARAAASSRTSLLANHRFRSVVVAAVAVAAFTATLLVAYELAQARVPQHRAALEKLVRAQTGLDVRFNELGLRWGWYGPEAVFRRVELGEPGHSSVLLRAPQLIVGFDAWRTMQTGQLAAGRITLVAPDIDLERLSGHARPVEGAALTNAPSEIIEGRARVLERWRGGRIDIQGGTLRLPDPRGATGPLTLQIRRASLRRSENDWSAYGLVFLPERLGRTARIAAQLTGDLSRPESLSGGLRFEGIRLAFAGWRELLDGSPRLARGLPARGGGDVTLHLTFKDGHVDKSDGQVKAEGVTFSAPPWIDDAEPAHLSAYALNLDYLAGEWRYVRRAGGAHVQVEQLVLDRRDKNAPLPRLSIELGPDHIHGLLARAPLGAAAAVARWLAPEVVPAGIVLSGSAQDLDFDWNGARPEGQRLAASARVDDTGIAASSGRFALSGLRASIAGSESRVAVELNADSAQLEMKSLGEQPIERLKVAARLAITRGESGWKIEAPQMTLGHEAGDLVLNGALVAGAAETEPVLDLHGRVARADIARLQRLFADGAARVFGTAAARLTSGRIENATFEMHGGLDSLFPAPATFNGSLTLRDARVTANGLWPDTDALDARIEWNGPLIRASIEEGRAGAFQLDSVDAQWDASGERETHVTGRARARLERALAWVRTHPEVQEHVPHLQDIVARGDALFDFDVSVPPVARLAPRGAPPRTRTHVAVALENVQFRLATELPPVESLRGSLAFDGGRMQRSTLSATWLGGPLTLKLSEHRDRRGNAMAVQAQGFIDAGKLVALSQLEALPDVSGETPWSGDFLYTPPGDDAPARWQGRADSNLIGIASALPAPFAKAAGASVPLHVEISGSGNSSDVHVNLAERVRSVFGLTARDGMEWRLARGAIRVGTGAATLPATDMIAIQGHVKRLDLPGYVLAWQQLRKGADTTPTNVDITTDELALGTRIYADASLKARQLSDATDLRIESESLGLLTGTLAPGTSEVVFKDLRLVKQALQGEGVVHCGADLATCNAKFKLATPDTAATLADLGFRAELSAARGSLSGDVDWQPRIERPWLETATGELRMRFDDGVARNPANDAARPFGLLTVPALLGGVARPAGNDGTQPGELRFTRLEATFELRGGQAYTSDLHFDGDAEILVRGRTGLLARDYDHEAWVLRGEDRIPTAVRRLAAAPRVAAAWMTLRELIRGDAADRSRIVLHLRGTWTEPVVTLD